MKFRKQQLFYNYIQKYLLQFISVWPKELERLMLNAILWLSNVFVSLINFNLNIEYLIVCLQDST